MVKDNGATARSPGNLPTTAQPCEAYAINAVDLLQFSEVELVRPNRARASKLETSEQGSIPWRVTARESGHAPISFSERKSNFSSGGPTRCSLVRRPLDCHARISESNTCNVCQRP